MSRLEHSFGLQLSVLNWFRSYLLSRTHFVTVNDIPSQESYLRFGVPQGSVLGPVLFIMYTSPLTDLIDRHSVSHEMFADDTQLQNSAIPSEYDKMAISLQSCIADIEHWMSINKLKLNCEKTEAIRFTKPSLSTTLTLPPSITLGSSTIGFSDSVRDLGIFLDNDLSMKQHVLKICQSAYIELKRIGSIRPYLTEGATKTLVTSYILSRLDYGNSVLIGCPQCVILPLQRVQNSAARLVCKAPRTQSCIPLLKKLHWLPVDLRIQYKCCCLCFKIISGSAPSYLSDLFKLYTPSRSLRSSADNRIFTLSTFTRKQHGQRAFSHSAAVAWNSLPHSVRHCEDYNSFKSNLKTHFFKQHFD